MAKKSRRRPVSTDKRFKKPAKGVDYGTTERWQHSGRTLEHTDSPGVLAARATEEHILDRLLLKGMISRNQSEAAFKLKLDFQRAGLAAHVIGGYNPILNNTDYAFGGRERNDYEEGAYRRWRHAVRELGLYYSEVVVTTVCHDQLPDPRAALLLQKGLDKLVDWYHLPKDSKASGQNIDQAAARQVTRKSH